MKRSTLHGPLGSRRLPTLFPVQLASCRHLLAVAAWAIAEITVPTAIATETVIHPTGYWSAELPESSGNWQVQASSSTRLYLSRDSRANPSRKSAILEFPLPPLGNDDVVVSARLSFVGENRTLFNRAEVRLLPTDRPVSAADAELSAGTLLAVYGYSGVLRFSLAQDITDSVHFIAAKGGPILRVSLHEATGLPWRNGALVLTSPTLVVETGFTRLRAERQVTEPGVQGIVLSFLTKAEGRYQIQSSLDLANWESAPGIFVGTGDRVIVTNIIDPDSALRVFRVIAPTILQ